MNEVFAIAQHLPFFALVLSRCAGIMLAAPVFSHSAISTYTKAALCALLAYLLFPISYAHPTVIPASILAFMPLLLTELGIGLALGFAGSLFLAALHAAGELIAQQLGLSEAEVASPDLEAEGSSVGEFLGIIGLLLFLAVDGHHWFIRALALTCEDIPIGGVHWRPALTQSLVAQFTDLFVIALRMAAPLLAILFLATVVIALMAKAVPQMNLLLVGYPVKVFVGVVALALTFPLMLPVLAEALQNLQTQLTGMLRLF